MKPNEEHSDCCYKNLTTQVDKDIKKLFNIFIVIGSFMVLELWGHWVSNTLSLLADSVHLLVDLIGFVVSLIALKWTKKQSTRRMNFGYGRIEIMGALFSIMLIWAAVWYLLLEAYYKYRHPHKINEKIFVTISVIGFFVNILCVFLLHDNHHCHTPHAKNLNMRAAYVHVIGDLIQSIGVVVASAITYFYPEWVIADVICTIIFSIMVLITTGNVLLDGLKILSERVPSGVDIFELKKEIIGVKNVFGVVDIKAWAISAKTSAVNVTVVIEQISILEYEVVLRNVRELLENKGFEFINIQIETFDTFYENGNVTLVDIERINEEKKEEERGIKG